jgi:predicted Fe-Mo cluster-binding NifX family protein
MARIWKELKLPGISVQKIYLNIFPEVSVLEEDMPEEASEDNSGSEADSEYNPTRVLFTNYNFDMNKRIAIPLQNGILCSHFGHCEQFAIINAEDHSISAEDLLTPPPHEPGLLPAWLAEKGVTDVIAGGMGQRAISLFNQQNINVFVGAQIKTPKELATDLLNGSLVAGSNYCDH